MLEDSFLSKLVADASITLLRGAWRLVSRSYQKEGHNNPLQIMGMDSKLSRKEQWDWGTKGIGGKKHLVPLLEDKL